MGEYRTTQCTVVAPQRSRSVTGIGAVTTAWLKLRSSSQFGNDALPLRSGLYHAIRSRQLPTQFFGWKRL